VKKPAQAAKRRAAEKKPPKKSAVKPKAAPKKAAPKKAAPKKPAPKKAAPKKPAPKKAAPKKPAPKKAAPKKPGRKKAAARKPVARTESNKPSPSATPPLAPASPPAGPLVLWMAAEAVPWAHTGGLGDVVGSLPAVLRSKGWDVRLCLPLYGSIRREGLAPSTTMTFEISVGAARAPIPVAIREALDPPGGVPTYLIECALFDRAGIYGDNGRTYDDNPFRFGVWQLAARELAARLTPAPALLHCHDWHAALIPTLVKLPGRWPAERRQVRTVFTIHNLEYQGDTDSEILDQLGLPRQLWHPLWLEHFGAVNFLKGAILSADLVSTVSRSYADEIRTPAFGMGLDGPLRDRGPDVTGILNGIDVTAWNPATDSALAAHFDAEHREGRSRCSAALRAELALTGEPTDLLLGFIGRLTDSKGVDLLIDALPRLFSAGVKAVVLGSGDQPLEAALLELQRAYPDNFRAILRFDAALARRVYAGVDVMVVPSRTEPCGLVQLYALRYGAVPVVHAVGGLRDTVREGKTGFLFDEPTPEGILAAVARALEVFRDPPRWSALVSRAMEQDWSWHQSATGYDALYRHALEKPAWERPLPAPEDDQPLFVDYGPDLPAALGRNELRLMVQSPTMLYAYWETAEAEALTLLLEERPTGYLFALAPDLPPVGDFWTRARPEHAYRAKLCRADGSVVRASNLVLTPRDAPVAPGEETPAWLDLLLASGPLDHPGTADRWGAIFPEPATAVDGAPGTEEGDGAPFAPRPGGAPPASQPMPAPAELAPGALRP
jgi:starch synthase